MKQILLLISIFLIPHYSASAEHDTLILGCRPWDDNISWLSLEADFIDFNSDKKNETPTNFFQYDFNNNKIFGAKDFSDLANEKPEKYQTIVLDWATYQHVRRVTAWQEFLSMLKPEGRLIVPIFGYDLREKTFTSEEKCNAFLATLESQTPRPSSIKLCSFTDTTAEENTWYQLLSRGRIPEDLARNGWLLIATK